jgi:hypothetical protein
MLTISSAVIIFLRILFPPAASLQLSQVPVDTSVINSQNKSLLMGGRKNPDLTIYFAHQTMAASKNINYDKGVADACSVLGMAWLAKYNKGDSALFYYEKAYDIYSRINDNRGKALACYGLAYVYSFKGDLDTSERYSTLSLDLFKQAGYLRGIVNAYHGLSYIAQQQKDLGKALSLIEKAIETARTAKDTLSLADVINSLGNIYKDMALFSRAIDTYFEALKLWELKSDSGGMAIAYGSIGLMYFYQKDWDKALEFNFKKVPLSYAEGNLWEVSKTYNTIAQIFNSTDRYDSALVYLRKSLRLNLHMNYTSGIADSYHDIATTYLLTPDADSALWYISKAVSLAKQIDDHSLVNYYITLGKVQKLRGNYKLALNNALNSYNMAKDLGLPIVVYEASSLLSDLYSMLNRKDLAYEFLREHRQLGDSISNDEFLKKATRLEIQYDYDKKQKEAEYARMEERIVTENRIRQQVLIVNGLLILLVLLSFTSLLYIRHTRLRARYASINLEQRLLRAQMNPHFIFNSLSAVQDFILSGNPQKANAFLTKIARLMRNILENSREEYIPLEKELETIRLYLDLQQLRFENGFDYFISLDEKIDPENFSIPPMLTQPCVENSIEHGLLPLKNKGKLKIAYTLNNGLMILEVTDNGIGRKEAEARAEVKGDKRSVSTKVTTERLENFRKLLRQKRISYEITDLYDNDRAAGTKVVMMLPYRKIFI